MADLIIKDGRLLADDWQILTREQAEASPLPSGRLVLPLAVWLAGGEALAERPETGVWLDSHEDPAPLAPWLDRLPVVAVRFPRLGDGRGYSIARRLRGRLGYAGELRAFGEVLRDQFEPLTRCGFDALQPPAGRYARHQLAAALAAGRAFSQPYQAAVIPVQPLFRRVARGA